MPTRDFGNIVNIAERDNPIIDGELNALYVDQIGSSVFGKIKTMLENHAEGSDKLKNPFVTIAGDPVGFIVEAKFELVPTQDAMHWFVSVFDIDSFHRRLDEAVLRALVNWKEGNYGYDPIEIAS